MAILGVPKMVLCLQWGNFKGRRPSSFGSRAKESSEMAVGQNRGTMVNMKQYTAIYIYGISTTEAPTHALAGEVLTHSQMSVHLSP